MDYPFNQVAALDDPPAQSDAPPVVDPSIQRFTPMGLHRGSG